MNVGPLEKALNSSSFESSVLFARIVSGKISLGELRVYTERCPGYNWGALFDRIASSEEIFLLLEDSTISNSCLLRNLI